MRLVEIYANCPNINVNIKKKFLKIYSLDSSNKKIKNEKKTMTFTT